MAESTQNTNLIEVIVSDHREVEGAFAQLEQGQGDAAERKAMVDQTITELVRHSVAEEQYMYPAARRVLSDGDEIADHEIDEHAEAERVMKDLSGSNPGDEGFEDRRRHRQAAAAVVLQRMGSPRFRDQAAPGRSTILIAPSRLRWNVS